MTQNSDGDSAGEIVSTCPNCRQPAKRIGNELTCEACDAVYRVTKIGEAKVKNVGAIEDLKRRVERIESILPETKLVPTENPQLESTDESEGDDDDILPR